MCLQNSKKVKNMNGETTIYFEFSGFVKVFNRVSLTEVNVFSRPDLLPKFCLTEDLRLTESSVWISDVILHIFFFFFLRGRGNESCSLIGF